MDQLTYARAQMGMSLAFHIVFAAAGVALPLFMVIADHLHHKTGDPDYLEYSKRMVMGTFGDVVGLPFAMEGFAFFTEAIFLGIYLYGRGRIPRRLHFLSGVAVAVSGMLSAFFVTCVNAIMNDPSGFRLEGGRPVDI